MKKTISMLLVCALLIGCVFALASCAKTLSGKYELGSNVLGTSYEFNGNKVTITYKVLGFEKTAAATYEIKKNDAGEEVIVIALDTGAEDSADEYAGEFSFIEGKEGDTSYIKIGGVQYNKVTD